MPEERREKLEQLDRLPLRTSDGGLIPLGKVANVSIAERVSTINREAAQRRAALLVNLRGRDVQSWVNEAQEKLAAQIVFQAGWLLTMVGLDVGDKTLLTLAGDKLGYWTRVYGTPTPTTKLGPARRACRRP